MKSGPVTNALGERGNRGVEALSPRSQRFAQSSAKQTKQSDKQNDTAEEAGSKTYLFEPRGVVDTDALWLALGIRRRDWSILARSV